MGASRRVRQLGKVYFVGAGPGDPGLITLRGVECLRIADAVLYDCLANPKLLTHTRQDAECISLGRHGRTRICSLEEITDRLVELAHEGKQVVRLKGGDPAVFARGAEEVAALRRAGVPYEIVPGVTAALAAASYVEVPITHREFSSVVSLIVGQEDASKSGELLDYSSLAAFPGTLVFYMGVTTAPRWATALLEGGKSPGTPVLIIRRATYPDQLTIRCQLDTVAETIARTHLRPPAIMVVGPVAALAPERGWFEARPLFGQSVLVTRPEHQAASLAELFTQQGADVKFQPAIQIQNLRDWSEVDRTLAALDQFDWLVFSSANGVRALLDRITTIGRDLRVLGGIHLAAIGPGTSACLRDYRLNVDLQPDRFQAEDLADSLAADADGKRFLLARASRGREVLAEQLRQAGGDVHQVVVYDSIDVDRPSPEITADLEAGRIDWITVTSSAIARSLDLLFGSLLMKTRLVSISPITTQTLRELGHEPTAEAEEATMPKLVEAVVRYGEQETG